MRKKAGSHHADESGPEEAQEQPCSSKQSMASGQAAPNKTKITPEELETIFERFDTEHSGFVDIKRLKLVMRALGFDCRTAEIERLVSNMMKNEAARAVRQDAFSAEELAFVLEDRLSIREDEVTKGEVHGAFSLFDIEGKGFINLSDLRRVATELGENFTDSDLQAMIEEADSSKRGRVCETDFANVMKKTSLY